MKQIVLTTTLCIAAAFLWACSGATGNNGGTPSSVLGSSQGNDMFYEFTSTTSGSRMNISGDIKFFMSAKGNARVEMIWGAPGAKGNVPPTMILIGKFSTPDESTSIDPINKTYTVNHFDHDSVTSGFKGQSTVTKIGEETLLGFHCIHARVISTSSMGRFSKGADTIDVWKSNDVPAGGGSDAWMKLFNARAAGMMFTSDAVKKLQVMGCDGFLVRMVTHTYGTTLDQMLTKVEHRDLSSALFTIPLGYTEKKSE